MQALTTTVFNLYLAIVCAFSLLASVIIAGNGVSQAIRMVFPNTIDTISVTRFDESTKTEVARDPAVVEAEKQRSIASQRYYNTVSMFESLGYFLLAGGVFALHWRIFRRRVALADLLTPEPKTKSKK